MSINSDQGHPPALPVCAQSCASPTYAHISPVSTHALPRPSQWRGDSHCCSPSPRSKLALLTPTPVPALSEGKDHGTRLAEHRLLPFGAERTVE